MSEKQAIQKLDTLIECFNKINMLFDNMNDTRWGEEGYRDQSWH